MKMSRNAVNEFLSDKLIPGEAITCTVYCGYKVIGFLANSNVFPAAAAVTNLGRIFIVASFLTNTTGCFVLKTAKTLKISKNLFGQHNIDFTFPTREGDCKFRLQIASKVYGCDFPNQKDEVETLLSDLRKYAVG